ncbi:hypothetical protein QYF36_019153 [Acer negundo]|nr:hypothetical protein QYF36_019153 [Acer negundo]
MFLQLSISKTIKKSIPKCNDARTFLKAVSRKFKKQSKAERGKYLNLLTTTVMMEEEAIRKSKNKSAHTVTHSDKGNKKFYRGKKFRPHGKKTGKSDGFNKAKDVRVNSWWVDSGATIHVMNSMQGFRSKRKPSDQEVVIFKGNGEKVFVEFMDFLLRIAFAGLNSSWLLVVVFVGCMDDLLIFRRFGLQGCPSKALVIKSVIWSPPARGWIKVNTDGIAMGSLGVFTFEAELLAASLAINFAWKNGWHRIWLESDSSYMVQLLSSRYKMVL